MQLTNKQVIETLKKVSDPELQCDIYTLGLIYNIDITGEKAIHITHTYTSPMCPYGPKIQDDIRRALVDIGFQEIEIELTFDPPWKPSEELRTILGLP